MFSRQTPVLAAQLRGHVPDPVISALESVLGNGVARLHHRGPITLEIDGNYLPSIGSNPRGGPIPKNCAGNAKAALTVRNLAGRFSGLNCETTCVDHGLALRVIGPSQLDSARIDRLFVNEVRSLCGTLIAKGGEDGGGDPGGGETPTGISKFNVLRFRVTNETVAGQPNAVFARLVGYQNGYAPIGGNVVVIDYTPTTEFSKRWRLGFYGYCIQQADRKTIVIGGTTYPCYEVLWVESYARFITFRLSTNVSGGQAEGTVLRTWGATAGVSPGSAVLLKDRLGKLSNGRIGYQGIAIHDEIAKEYVILADETPGIAELPLESTVKCAKITDGKRKTECVYPGILVDPTNVAGVCSDLFSTVAPIWLFIPNFRTDVNPGSYHWVKRVIPEFEVDGEIRPLYFTSYDPDDFVTLRIQAGNQANEDCVYPAKIVKFDYDAAREGEACDIIPEDGDDVFVFMPNFGECDVIDKDVYLLARRIAANTYAAMESFYDECSQLAVVGTANQSFTCGTEDILNTVTDSPGVEPHLLNQSTFGGDTLSSENLFNFCGSPQAKVLSLIEHVPNEQNIQFGKAILAQHQCSQHVTSVSPSGLCKIQYNRMPLSIPVCGPDRLDKLDISGVVCDCPCDGNSGDCECFGPNDRVTATITFRGVQICPDGNEAVTEKAWNVALSFDAASGWHQGTFTTTDPIPKIYYIVLYHCGNEPAASRTGFVTFDCNIPQENGPFAALLDEDGQPVAGNCVVDVFTWDRTNPFVFDPADCISCTQTYRVRVKCNGMVVNPDGSVRPDIASRLSLLHKLSGVVVPDEVTLGAVVDGDCNYAKLEELVSTGWGNGAPGYENHVFAGFKSGSGVTELIW